MSPLASAKKRHVASPSHAKKSAKRAKKVVTVTKVRPTRVASAAPVVTAPVTRAPAPAPAPAPAALAPTPAAPPAPTRAPSPPIDRSHPAEQLSDDEVPGSRLKKR